MIVIIVLLTGVSLIFFGTTLTAFITATGGSTTNITNNITNLAGGNVSAVNVSNGTFGLNVGEGLYAFPSNLTVNNTIIGMDGVRLQADATLLDSTFALNETSQIFGSSVHEVRFLAVPSVNFTNLIGDVSVEFDVDSVNVFQDLELKNKDFDYPTGGYSLIRHSPVVSDIDETFPRLELVVMSPNWTYTTPINIGFGLLSALIFTPKLIPAELGVGVDIATVNAALFSPQFLDPSQNRTLVQLLGIAVQPVVQDGIAATVKGILINPVLNKNGTTTTGNHLDIANFLLDDNATLTTQIGINIGDLTAATTNFAIQSEGDNTISYHDGNFGFAGCKAPDHDLSVGGTGAGCNTGTFSEMNAGEATFAISSSADLKENFELVSRVNILDKVSSVEVFTYDFKARNFTESRLNETSQLYYNVSLEAPQILDRMGFKAEDFHTIFGRGDDKTIKGDEIMMAMWLSIQELIDKNTELEDRVRVLEGG